ncbi:MAG: hypothetical protein ACI8RD_008578, partial [Bacillariaceae sp.]
NIIAVTVVDAYNLLLLLLLLDEKSTICLVNVVIFIMMIRQ